MAFRCAMCMDTNKICLYSEERVLFLHFCSLEIRERYYEICSKSARKKLILSDHMKSTALFNTIFLVFRTDIPTKLGILFYEISTSKYLQIHRCYQKCKSIDYRV